MAQVSPKSNDVIKELWEFYGDEPVVSDWFTVTQEDMDKFAAATHDPDWMHIDPERAHRDGPFDGTIAFGFWTMSMLTYFARQTSGREYPEGVKYGFNYGFDKVRLMAPIPVGSRIRNHSQPIDIEDKGDVRFLVKTENRVEVEGVEKPAMIAVWLMMLVCGEE